MIYGNIAKQLTILGLIVSLIILSITYLFKNNNCESEINSAINEAISNERIKFKELQKNNTVICNLTPDNIDNWLQSNDGFRQE